MPNRGEQWISKIDIVPIALFNTATYWPEPLLWDGIEAERGINPPHLHLQKMRGARTPPPSSSVAAKDGGISIGGVILLPTI